MTISFTDTVHAIVIADPPAGFIAFGRVELYQDSFLLEKAEVTGKGPAFCICWPSIVPFQPPPLAPGRLEYNGIDLHLNACGQP